MKLIIFLICLLLLNACTRAPLQSRTEVLRPTVMPPIADDLGLPHLVKALESHILQLKNKKETPLQFGPITLTAEQYASHLQILKDAAVSDNSGEAFKTLLNEKFEAWEVYGSDEWGQVFITSYFEPVIPGSLKKEDSYTYPLYSLPKDLVTIDLKSFKVNSTSTIRGKFVPATSSDTTARVEPYLTRAEIAQNGLKSVAKPLAWVDPIDGFFLEIQGSGVVQLKKGQDVKVGYASQNGHPYSAIGKHLFDVIPPEKMTQHTLESYLRSLPKEEAQKLMEMNLSQVFFRKIENRGVTAFGTEVVSGRTIATDSQLFPKGGLAFLVFDKPIFDSPQATEPVSWQPTSRFVLDQDTGGAIRGPHRVDLFWGQGAEAKQSAGVMKNKGRLVYLLPKGMQVHE